MHGGLHRKGGEIICLIYTDENGNKFWYRIADHNFSDKNLHREDGPAVIRSTDTYQAWWINGKRHRIEGPARIWANDNQEWYYNGQKIGCHSQEEFEHLIKLKAFW